MQFLSDNTSTACPEILAALSQANQIPQAALKLLQ